MARFTLTNVRLSFPHVFEKAEYDGKPTKFEATLLIPKDDEAQLELIRSHAKAALKEKFGTPDKIPKGITKGVRFCLRDGDDVEYDGYSGCMSFKAANGNRPRTMDRKKEPIGPESGLLYAGCYVDAIVEIWVQNNKYGSRINANLMALRHREDGEAFGAGGIPNDVDDDFDDLDDEAVADLDTDDIDM